MGKLVAMCWEPAEPQLDVLDFVLYDSTDGLRTVMLLVKLALLVHNFNYGFCRSLSLTVHTNHVTDHVASEDVFSGDRTEMQHKHLCNLLDAKHCYYKAVSQNVSESCELL